MKAILLSCCLLISASTWAQVEDWIGLWEGTLVMGKQKMGILFNITTNGEGKLEVLMDIPGQNLYELEMNNVTLKGDELSMTLRQSHLEYTGKMSKFKSTIKGTWTQGVPMILDMYRSKKKPVVHNRPQEPKGPFEYAIEEVTYENKKAGVTLAGTLTTPKKKGKYPVVILISGSGPQNRNSAILKHKPFWVLADYLTNRGIAVLRFDDRGFGKSTGDHNKATSADFATDVLAGVEFLKKHPKINKRKIGLMGHSEGGMIAPLAAKDNKDIDFIVLLAGPGLKGWEVLATQNTDILRKEGAEDYLVKQFDNINRKLFKAVAEDTERNLDIVDFITVVQKDLDEIEPEDRAKLGLTEMGVQQKIAALQQPWMRYFLNYDPAPVLQRIKCPVLALNGDKDLQIAGEANLAGIEAGLAHNKSVTCKLLPNLNHLFQNCETGKIEEYLEIEETFSPDALKIISDWIIKTTK